MTKKIILSLVTLLTVACLALGSMAALGVILFM